MRSYKKLSVGIKELKDRASEIIALVQRTGQAVSITKNQQEVARIMAVPAGAHERLIAAGLVQPARFGHRSALVRSNTSPRTEGSTSRLHRKGSPEPFFHERSALHMRSTTVTFEISG